MNLHNKPNQLSDPRAACKPNRDTYSPLDIGFLWVAVCILLIVIVYFVQAELTTRNIVICDYIYCSDLFRLFPPAGRHIDDLVAHGFGRVKAENGMIVTVFASGLMIILYGGHLLWGIYKLIRHGEDRQRFSDKFLFTSIFCFVIGIIPILILFKETIRSEGHPFYFMTYRQPISFMVARIIFLLSGGYFLITLGMMSLFRYVNQKIYPKSPS